MHVCVRGVCVCECICVCVCVCMCMCMCMRMWMCMCMCMCMRMCMHMYAYVYVCVRACMLIIVLTWRIAIARWLCETKLRLQAQNRFKTTRTLCHFARTLGGCFLSSDIHVRRMQKSEHELPDFRMARTFFRQILPGHWLLGGHFFTEKMSGMWVDLKFSKNRNVRGH